MQIKYCLPDSEIIVRPYISVASIEDQLIEYSYLVVKENTIFHGILTQADVIKKGHQLVIDCITPKKTLYQDEDIRMAIEIMKNEKQQILHVFDEMNNYVGSISHTKALQEVGRLRRQPVQVKITNTIGIDNVEEDKEVFLRELHHHTRNPIQIILCSTNLLRGSTNAEEQEELLETIEECTQQIEDIINQLHLLHSIIN